jgi:hypothetical protein
MMTLAELEEHLAQNGFVKSGDNTYQRPSPAATYTEAQIKAAFWMANQASEFPTWERFLHYLREGETS